jgi:hypothetical protein
VKRKLSVTVLLWAALVLTAFSGGAGRALADSSALSLPPTWHIHDCTSGCVLPHAPVGFFPRILTGGNVQAYLADPAACPDATDKAFLGGGQPPATTSSVPGNPAHQPLREGVCMTSTTIIHLKSISPDQPAPNGWTYLSTSGGYATYYSLTSR